MPESVKLTFATVIAVTMVVGVFLLLAGAFRALATGEVHLIAAGAGFVGFATFFGRWYVRNIEQNQAPKDEDRSVRGE